MSGGDEHVNLPADLKKTLQILELEFKEEDITLKGYCKKKLMLLNDYLPKKLSSQLSTIQENILKDKSKEAELYLKISKLLSLKNIFPSSQNKDESSSKQNKRKLENKENVSLRKSRRKLNSIKSGRRDIPLGAPKEIVNDSCEICNQTLNNLIMYDGHPNGAVDEIIALADPKLMLFTGDEEDINQHDILPHNKVTHFSIYDKFGHLCAIDSGLIEKNVLLHFSGYIKPMYDDNPSPVGGISAKDLGPINEWFVTGFDGGEKAVLGLNTAYGEYYLMEPSPEYLPVMKTVREKMYLTKIIIEFLVKESRNDPNYEDLLGYLQDCVTPEDMGELSEEQLLRHAQFICNQVNSFDAARLDDDLLISTACMRSIIELAGVNFHKRLQLRKTERIEGKKKRKKRQQILSKATTTKLVRDLFESVFSEQLDELKIKRTRCGICGICQLPDCGKCPSCLDKSKFGGKGKTKQACQYRRCPNIAIQDANDSDSEPDTPDPTPIKLFPSKNVLHSVIWPGKPVKETPSRIHYQSALVGNTLINLHDFVFLRPEDPTSSLLIFKITSMFQDIKSNNSLFHAQYFSRGRDTILAETSDPFELFVLDECEDLPLGSIVNKASVVQDPLQVSNTFFFRKRYDRNLCRFTDFKIEPVGTFECDSCRRKELEKKNEIPRFSEDGVIVWRREEYKKGVGVYLKSFSLSDATSVLKPIQKQISDPVDEEIYSEFYRKKSNDLVSASYEISEPFCIGYIQQIITKFDPKFDPDAKDILVYIQRLYRPENTQKEINEELDLNLLYWSEEQMVICFSQIVGRCHLMCSNNLSIPVEEWSSQGPNRFYFSQTYNKYSSEFVPVNVNFPFLPRDNKGKGPGKGSSKTDHYSDVPDNWPVLDKPLRCMDMFAGCGGLSEGLHQSGLAETKWAVEKDSTAAHAFKLNNPDTSVFTDDCNELLKLILSGATKTETGQLLPQKGDVDLLCGGPPCQGFSGMNRFHSSQYSLFKNSLISSYLSYCDYYRPKYFILENVRTFASFQQSMVLKLTLRCLLAMGYQCTFGILQAGNYGVPQSRRRLILLAAAPGEVLPQFPEPTHVFYKRSISLGIRIDNCRYTTGSKWLGVGAPYRMITVKDAMSDLPAIFNGFACQEIPSSLPLSHFQRLLHSSDDQLLRDHICKEMSPIVAARISYIPTANGSDWRDLPNIKVRLSDGTFAKKLQYNYHDRKNGPNAKGGKRGVCACAERNVCDSSDRQFNTLIPWCLPHTANRHNQWGGLYGRLEWSGVFETTVTNPEPMGKQGKVLHPEQNRVVSVRECARSQGFPDKYRFYGNVLDKYRQIGNAVPPPLGCAIGREIIKAIVHK